MLKCDIEICREYYEIKGFFKHLYSSYQNRIR